MFEVVINGTTLDKLEQSNPLSYDDVKVWAATPKGDRDPPPADAELRNLKIESSKRSGRKVCHFS